MTDGTTEQQGMEGAPGAAASPEPTPEPSQSAESDFKARAQRDPEWAWEQVRSFQSKADKLQSAEEKYTQLVEKLGPAQQLIDTYGADRVAEAAIRYATLLDTPEFGEVLKEWQRTGQLPKRNGSAPNTEEDDEYLTDTERRLSDKVSSLESELLSLKQSQSQHTLTAGREMLTRHMEKVFAEYAFTPEDTEKMRQAVISQFDSWSRLGSAGEQAVRAVMTPNGEQTVRGIMLGAVTPENLRAAAANVNLRKRQGLSSLATDGPGAVGSAGKEPPPIFETAAQAAKFAAANPDAHDSW